MFNQSIRILNPEGNDYHPYFSNLSFLKLLETHLSQRNNDDPLASFRDAGIRTLLLQSKHYQSISKIQETKRLGGWSPIVLPDRISKTTKTDLARSI